MSFLCIIYFYIECIVNKIFYKTERERERERYKKEKKKKSIKTLVNFIFGAKFLSNFRT